MKTRINKIIVPLLAGLISLTSTLAYAGRCATNSLGRSDVSFHPGRPAGLGSGATLGRGAVPTQIENGEILTTAHFRIFWGKDWDRNDKDWAEGTDGTPLWISTIAEAFEYSYERYAEMGFAPPYGADKYYIDIYVANTGLSVYSDKTATYESIALFSDYYAYTNINRDYAVAYFILNDDFSTYSKNEIPVLKAVSAHELFHAVQRGEGYPWDAENADDGPEYIDAKRWLNEGWWLEASASWMEDEVYPEVNDYTKYVSVFLAAPYQPLFTVNGLHEYGASIFAGYVRYMTDGLDAIVGVLADAYPKGLEEALRGQVAKYTGDTLENAVTKFWSMAAHPSGFWPDGSLYETDYAPKVCGEVYDLPYSASAPAGMTPGRFGANLYTVETGLLPAPVSLQARDPQGEMRFALADGASPYARVADPAVGLLEPPVIGDGTAYGAVVNVSPKTTDYDLTIGDKSETGGGGGGSGGGGGGGGCFIGVLMI